MAKPEKKIKTVNAKPVQKKKKKKGCGCCGCFLSATLVFVVLISLGVAGGFVFANNYLKSNFGVSIGQSVDVLKTLYKGDRETIVTNAPTPEDEQAFYDAVGGSLMLKSGTVSKDTITPIFDSLGGGESGGEGGSESGGEEQLAPAEAQLKAVRLAAEEGDVTGTLANLISRENADMERLAEFDEDYDFSVYYDEDFVTTISDRQMMALVKGLIDGKLQDNAMLEKLAIDQLILAKNSEGAPVVTLTASCKVTELVMSVIPQSEQIPSFVYGIIPKILPKEVFVDAEITMADTNSVRIVINKMDDETYANMLSIISGALRLAGKDVDAQTFLNDYFNQYASSAIETLNSYVDLKKNIGDNGTIRFDLYSMLAGALFKDKGVTGQELAFVYTSMLTADAEKMVKNNEEHLFENNYLVVDNGEKEIIYSAAPVENGELIDYKQEFMDEFEAKFLMRTSFYRDGAEASKTYLQPAYKYIDGDESVVLGTPELKDAYGSELPVDGDGKPLASLWYKPSDGSGNASVSVTEDAVHTVELTLLDYVELKFEDVAALMGIGSSEKIGNVQLYSLFDASGMRKELYKIDGDVPSQRDKWFVNQPRTGEGDTLTFNLTEKMLAALVDAQMGTLMDGGNELISALKMKWTALSCGDTPETVELTETQPDGTELPTGGSVTVTRRYMAVGFEAKTEALFADMSMLSGIVGESIGLIVKVDITPELEDKYLNAPVIEYCDLGATRTDKILNVLSKAGMENFDMSTMTEQIAQPIRQAITTMNTTMGEVTIRNGVIDVPDAFTLIKTQMFKRDESKQYKGEVIELSADDLQSVMRGLYNTPPMHVNLPGTEFETHYLSNGNGMTDGTQYEGAYDPFATVMLSDPLSVIRHDNYTDRALRLNALYHIKNNGSDNPLLQAAATVLPSLSSDLGDVVGYYDSEDMHGDYMFLTFEYLIAQYLEGADANASLLDVNTVYATFKVDKTVWYDSAGNETNDLASAVKYKTTLVINTMNEAEKTALLKMIVYLSTNGEEDADKFLSLENSIGKLAMTLEKTAVLKAYVDEGTMPSIPLP